MLTSSPCIGGDALHGVYFHPAVRHHQRQEEEEDSAAEGEKKQKTQLQRTGKVRNEIPSFLPFLCARTLNMKLRIDQAFLNDRDSVCCFR